jgi:hypothetical protein
MPTRQQLQAWSPGSMPPRLIEGKDSMRTERQRMQDVFDRRISNAVEHSAVTACTASSRTPDIEDNSGEHHDLAALTLTPQAALWYIGTNIPR